jgi:MFS family permease
MMAGWRARALLLLLVGPLPLLTGRVPLGVLLGALLALIAGFNAVRGFSSGAWIPWVAQVVPAGQRGRYFGREQAVVNTGVLLTLLVGGWVLGAQPQGWRYSVLFVAAGAAGLVSVGFLERVPWHRPGLPEPRAGGTLMEFLRRFRALWGRAAFRRVTIYTALQSLALGGFSGFLVVYLRDRLNLSERSILMLGSASTVGSLATARALGRLSDHAGSRPLMRLAGLGQITLLTLWWGSAAGWVPLNAPAVAAIYAAGGILGASSAIAQLRLFMGCAPAEEISVATTGHQVIVSVCLGLGPLAWGAALDAMHAYTAWNAYGVFFACAALSCVAVQVYLSRVPDRDALPTMSVLGKLFWEWPLRVLSGPAWGGLDRVSGDGEK